MVTRAIEQARELKDAPGKLGATVLLLPAVSFSEPADTDRAGSRDPLARRVRLDFVHQRERRSIFCGPLPQTGSGAGAGRKAALRGGRSRDGQRRGSGRIFRSIMSRRNFWDCAGPRIGESLAGKRVLLPRSDRAGRDLPDALRAAGAEVTEVVAYHTGGVGAAEPGVMDAVREARVDVVSFFSPSAVENLRGELGAEVLSRLGAKAALAAVGPVTAAALRKAGLPVAIEAPEATAESMAAAIENYFSMQAGSQARVL